MIAIVIQKHSDRNLVRVIAMVIEIVIVIFMLVVRKQ